MQPSIPGNTMTDNIYGAKLQRDGKTYAIQTRIPAGVVSPDDLETIARVAKKYSIPLVKITSGQRFLLVGVQEKDICNVRKDLGPLGYGIRHSRCTLRPVMPGHLVLQERHSGFHQPCKGNFRRIRWKRVPGKD